MHPSNQDLAVRGPGALCLASRRSSQFCRTDTAEPAPTDSATALEADQRKNSVPPTTTKVSIQGVIGDSAVLGVRLAAMPANPATANTRIASTRLRSAIHRNRVRTPSPVRTAEKRAPSN